MNAKDAVVKRFWELCEKDNIKKNELARRAGISPSSVYGSRQYIPFYSSICLTSTISPPVVVYFDCALTVEPAPIYLFSFV